MIALLLLMLLTGKPIAVGALYNLTGAQAGLDVPASRGARLAVDEVNARGGIRGRPVLLLLEDGKSDPQVIREKTRELLHSDHHLLGIVGFSDTDMVMAAAPEAATAGRVFLTSGATSPRLPEQVPGYLFLACFGDNVQAAAAAEWAYEARGARTARLIVEPGMEYTRLLSGYFKTRFEQLGGSIVEENPDVVFLAVGPDSVASEIARLRAGYSGLILGGDSLDVAGRPADENVVFTTHAYMGSPSMQPFVERYQAAYGEAPDAFSALGYDATMLLLSAVQRAGEDDLEEVREALEETRSFQGLTGELSYTEGERIPRKTVYLLNGKGELVQAVLPAKVPAP